MRINDIKYLAYNILGSSHIENDAEKIGTMTVNGVRYHLNALKKKGIIKRE